MAGTIVERWREWLTLRAAEHEARALPSEARAGARRALGVAFQEREAATELWPRGSSVEALKLARGALDHAAEALDALAGSVGDGVAWVGQARSIAHEARQRAIGRAIPSLESEVGAPEEETYDTLATALTAIEAAIGAKLDTPEEIARTRRARVGWTAATLAFGALLVTWLLHVPDFTRAGAMASRPDTPAELAIDGDPKTSWSAVDRQGGALELTMGRARSIRALRVLPYATSTSDRGAKDVHIEAFAGAQVVRAIDFSFAPPPGPGASPTWAVVPLDAPKCDHVRVDVKSYYGAAGAFAEVKID